MKGSGLFCRQFFRSFHTTGSIVPSSRYLARALAAPLREIEGPRKILEAGPGTGPVTSQLIASLRPDDTLTLCEINETFADHLETRLDKDPEWAGKRAQITLIRRDVREVLGPGSYHMVVSGLPLNNFTPAFVQEVVSGFVVSLLPGGFHTFFEYVGIRRMKMRIGPAKERERMTQVEKAVCETLAGCSWSRATVFANLPPAWVYSVQPSGSWIS
jgi:phospholipid N-methyltransferase